MNKKKCLRKLLNETEIDRAKRFLKMSGDYYTPQDFGFNTLEDIQMDREFYNGLYGDYIYKGYKIKDENILG